MAVQITEKKTEKLEKYELASKGKLILTRNLLAEIDYLHRLVGNIEWIGVLFYTKETGDIGDPSTLVLKADRLFLMDIGTSGHTEAIMDADEVLNMYDQIPNCMNLKQGLIHTHHSMGAFFSGEDWDELQINTPLHHYYLSLIVDHAGTYVAKVAYAAQHNNEFRYKNSNNEDVVSHINKKVMMVVDLDIVREDRMVEPYFVERYKYIKEKTTKPTFHWNGETYSGPYHNWPKREEASDTKKEGQGEVDQKSTFPRNERKGNEPYYRQPSNTLTYRQAQQICLDWLNEGLKLESPKEAKPFTTLTEGMTYFTKYWENAMDGREAEYNRWLNYMQRILVDVSAEYQPSVTSKRVEIQMKEYSYTGTSVARRIANDLAVLAMAHPVYLQELRKTEKTRKKGGKTIFVDAWGKEIE